MLRPPLSCSTRPNRAHSARRLHSAARVALVAFVTGPAVGARAETYFVPDDYATIGAAFDAAQDDDLIRLRAGVHLVEEAFTESRVRIAGETSATTTVRLVNGATLFVAKPQSMSNLTITGNGRVHFGLAGEANGDAIVSDCAFASMQSDSSVMTAFGLDDLTFERCTFTQNSCAWLIGVDDTRVTQFVDCLFRTNTITHALHGVDYQATVRLERTEVLQPGQTGILVQSRGTLELDHSTLIGCPPAFGDGVVTDLGGSVIETVCSCAEDLDGNGSIGFGDVLEIMADWGTPRADLDGDMTTDTTDLRALLLLWGDC